MKREYQAEWVGSDRLGGCQMGKLSSLAEGSLIDDAEKVLMLVLRSYPDMERVSLWIIDAGSGHFRNYTKQGQVWIRTYSDNLVPNWFPWFFLGLICLMFVGLTVLWHFCGR